jgi:hypothetical protein
MAERCAATFRPPVFYAEQRLRKSRRAATSRGEGSQRDAATRHVIRAFLQTTDARMMPERGPKRCDDAAMDSKSFLRRVHDSKLTNDHVGTVATHCICSHLEEAMVEFQSD